MNCAPSVQSTWTERDLDILRTLAYNVSMLTEELIAEIWWPATKWREMTVQKRLRQLCRAGFLERHTLLLHPLLPLTRPVFAWEPHQSAPEGLLVSRKLQSRWNQPAVSTRVYTVTKYTVALYGSYGSGDAGDIQKRNHERHMGEVYGFYYRHRPEDFCRWVGENALAKADWGVKNPDAFIYQDEKPIRVVEFGGSYDAKRVTDFHAYCKERDLPYELW